MRLRAPIFYVNFKCSADRCSDSCCIGWEIDIDNTTYEKYINQNTCLKEKLQSNISSDGGHHFILSSDERCPFLTKENLCNIIINCGDTMLCDICREHPRFYFWYGERKDAGLGLCCEEACKLLFGSHDSLLFTTKETDEQCENLSDLHIQQAKEAYEINEHSLNIIADRKLSLQQRIENLLNFIYGEKYQSSYKAGYFNTVISAAKYTEPFDDDFNKLIISLEDNFDLMLKAKKEFIKSPEFFESDYERLLSYLLFRWQIKGYYDGNLCGYTEFCIGILTFTYLTDLLCFYKSKAFTKQNRIENVKYISKQFEYSDINPESFIKNISI